MLKICIMGAGSTVFAKNIIGDCMLTPELKGAVFSLYDIDPRRLEESRLMFNTLNRNLDAGMKSEECCGVENRKKALSGADFVINIVQVGGYKPSTVIDFEIPSRYGLRQTVADTLGIGGIFRALRTVPVVNAFGRDMAEVCPEAMFLNYVNPMAMITGAFQHTFDIQSIGLCHSVQVCASRLLKTHEMETEGVRWNISGINHMAWLLEIQRNGQDLYPSIKDSYRRARQQILDLGGAAAVRKAAAAEPEGELARGKLPRIAADMIRHEIMLHFGYYVTESSNHHAEYATHWIRRDRPDLLEVFGIKLDAYLDTCEKQIKRWEEQYSELVENPDLTHNMSGEYANDIIRGVVEDKPYRVHGNVLNTGHLIDNLPENCCVEVPCLIDQNGINPCKVGSLPEVCAAKNRTNINVQLLTVEAALSGSKDAVYQAAMLDPHTSAELTTDETVSLCDDLIEAHGDMISVR